MGSVADVVARVNVAEGVVEVLPYQLVTGQASLLVASHARVDQSQQAGVAGQGQQAVVADLTKNLVGVALLTLADVAEDLLLV